MADTRPPRIFLSHTSADTRWCSRFVAYLEEAGADVWWDVASLRVGRLDQVINTELPSRSYFIVVLSPTAVQSEWVKAEISTALSLQLKRPDERIFLPVVARKCEIPPLIETYKRVTGRSDLTPKLAADQVIRALSLTPVRSSKTPRGKPKSVEDAVLRARSLIAQGRPQGALDMIEIALKLDASSAVAWSGKGRALHDLGQLDTAMDAFSCAITCDPTEPSGWAGRGQMRGERGEYAEALADLDQALKLKQDFLAPLLNRATVLLKLNRLDEALATTDEGMTLEPNYGPSLATRGRVLQALSRYDEALAAYETALITPDNPDAPPTTPEDWRTVTLFHKAELLIALNSSHAALAVCEQAIKRNDTSYFSWRSKGDALWHLGRHQEALDAYDRALKSAASTDEQASAWHGKGAALIGLRRPAEAKGAFTSALTLKPQWSEALSSLGDALRDLADLNAAADAYRDALGQGDLTAANSAQTLNSLAVIALKQGDLTQALTLIDQAIAVDPLVIRYWLNKVGFLKAANRQGDALIVQLQLGQMILARAEATLSSMPNVYIEPSDPGGDGDNGV